MIPQKNRIIKKDFPAPKRQGSRIFSPLFSGTFYKEVDEMRVAVVVSKKTAKTAVTRNLIRRRFYSIMELHQKNLTQKGLMVFYPKKEALTATFDALKAEVEAALRRARLIL